jgi:hypothetical protein
MDTTQFQRFLAERRNQPFHVGFVGYSMQKFDESKAREYVRQAFDAAEEADRTSFACVSGLTNMGIPKLAYEEAVKRGWKTVGVACEKAENYDLFPVDEKVIVGKEWGDESDAFLSRIEMLVRVGGGKQSRDGVNKA